MLNFIGIGAQKCGTSWLYETLSKVPKIAFPGGKEVHFWDMYQNKGLTWYAGLFEDKSPWYASPFKNKEHIWGDITPAYGILPVDTIKLVYERFPDVRLFYFIRNPIDRAWSAARMALSRSRMMHDEASDQWFIDHFNSRGSLARGDYEACIRNWLSVFPREQLFIARYEELQMAPVLLANRCLNHLGLESLFKDKDRVELTKPVFKGDDEPIRPQCRDVLVDMYEGKINSLEEYLNLSLLEWKS